MVGDEEGKGRHHGGGREGRGVGEVGANALLMVFIQAWKLQARPPHWQLGVNFPLLDPPLSLISDCCHSGEVENYQHQLQPPFHILDTSNATVKNKSLFTRLSLGRCNTAIFPTDVTIKHTGNFLYSASKFWANTTWVHSSVLKINKKQQPSASFPNDKLWMSCCAGIINRHNCYWEKG